VQPVAGDHAVGGAGVLDLEPGPPVRLVDPVQELGDHAVQAGALEARKPLGGQPAVGGGAGQVDRRSRAGEGVLQGRAAAGERLAGPVLVPERQQVEGDQPGRGLLSQQRDAAGGGVDAQQQRVPVQPPTDRVGDDDLGVDDAAGGRGGGGP